MSGGLTIDVFYNEKYRHCAESSRDMKHMAGSLSGMSARHDTLLVVNVPGPTPFDSDLPKVALVENSMGTIKLVPVVNCADEGEEPEWQMFAPAHMVGPQFGGNYGGTSDSRFSQACEEILGHRFYGAVPIHDRYESQETYDALSR